MRIICAPQNFEFGAAAPFDLKVLLYCHAERPDTGAVGKTALDMIQRRKLRPDPRAWDLLSIAFSVIAADTAVRRDQSPDGWTREIELQVAVSDPGFWTSQRDLLMRQLAFLTTDIWNIKFLDGGVQPEPPKSPVRLEDECVVLLSGGLDSLVGAIDLVTEEGKTPHAVSQTSMGDQKKQSFFASQIGGGLGHLQLNHNARVPGNSERSQRARSFVFFSYGVFAATTLKRYHDGDNVMIYVCENGFISINPPLTIGRIGSLSTRTTHPFFVKLFQELIGNAGIRVTLDNPYQFATKGEMLQACADQEFLQRCGYTSTSCGRYARNKYTHCGRCVPCLIRRAAFHAWGAKDETPYVCSELSRNDAEHARHDDVRSVAMADATVREEGVSAWAGPAFSTLLLDDARPYKGMVGRGLEELAAFLSAAGVT